MATAKKTTAPVKKTTASAKKAAEPAKTAAAKNRDEAERYRNQLVRNATIEVQEFDKAYASYKIAPDVTKRRMHDEMMSRVLGNNPVVVGGTGAPAPLPGPKAPAATQGGQQ